LKPTVEAPFEHFEWSLLTNALVEIRRDGSVIRTGFVEDAMPDSSALWISAAANDPRQMFEASEGYKVWVLPQELTGTLRYRMVTKEICKASPERNADQPVPRSGGKDQGDAAS